MIGELLALIGAIVVLLSALGVVRLGDVLARLHALAKASTLGLLLLAGAAVNLHRIYDITSVVLAGLLHLLTFPPASNMISRAVYLRERLPAGCVDEHPGAAQEEPSGT